MTLTAADVACLHCGAELVPEAAYCERCGARTRRAKRLINLAVRVEVLGVGLMLAMILGFAFIYLR